MTISKHQSANDQLINSQQQLLSQLRCICLQHAQLPVPPLSSPSTLTATSINVPPHLSVLSP